MADVAQLLETMHPMREPAAPAGITPYLVLLAAGCAIAGLALVVAWRLRQRRTALRSAVAGALAAAHGLAPAERLAAQAAVLRRLVRSLAGEEAARAQGEAWLERLDNIFATRFFTREAGNAFGTALYTRPRDLDLDAIERCLLGLVAKVRLP